MSIDAVLFDLDGTIIESEGRQYEAYRLLFRELDVELDGAFTWVGKRSRTVLDEVCKAHGLLENIETTAFHSSVMGG